MISSARSGFELSTRPFAALFARRTLFLGADKLAVYHWSGGELAEGFLFATDDEGKANFKRYLQQTPKTPFFILLDIFAEDYRQETIPHVFGADRTATIVRRIRRLFRSTPYYHHRLIGRQEEGRRDDHILLTAITDPALLTPWVTMLEAVKVPLAGMYSLPLFTESVLANIQDKPHRHTLIISIQSISGLRQTYFKNNTFRISRLVRMPRYGSTPYRPYIKQEVEKIRRYLTSLRLISTADPLQIYFLLAGELLAELKAEYADQGQPHYVFCDLNRLLRQAGSMTTITTPFSDRYFVQQLLKLKPADCYALKTEKRYFFMRRWRYGMVAMSIGLLLGGMIWSGINVMSGLGYQQHGLAARQKTQFYTTRYEVARQRLPSTPVPSADLKIAIELTDNLTAHKTSPLALMQLVSDSLEHYPSLHLLKLAWSATGQPSVPQAINAAASDTGARAAVDAYQVARIEGRMIPFAGDYRQAIAVINRFAESLRQNRRVHEVAIMALPLDVSPAASLKGNAQQPAGQADFSLRIVLRSAHVR